MPKNEDIQWLRSTANELNNFLQVISNSSSELLKLCPPSAESEKYITLLRSGLQRASEIAERLAHQVTDPPAPSAVLSADFTIPSGGEFNILNPDGERELVLIVDDEELVTLLVGEMLAGEGYRVLTAPDGFRALELYRRLGSEIALVILDFTMPVMDGSDVFNELLQLDPNVPVVLSSGFTEQERLRGMLAKGLRGFLPKPYTQDKLLSQIRATLDALRSERTGERRVL